MTDPYIEDMYMFYNFESNFIILKIYRYHFYEDV